MGAAEKGEGLAGRNGITRRKKTTFGLIYQVCRFVFAKTCQYGYFYPLMFTNLPLRMNKQLFLLALLAGICAGVLPAQTRFGFRAGVQLADVGYSGAQDPLYYIGILHSQTNPWFTFFAGGLAERDLTRNLTLSAELQLSGRGYSIKLQDGQQTTESKARAWYAQLPLVCNFRWNGLFAGAGPYLGIGLGGKYKSTFYDAVKNYTQEMDGAIRFGNSDTSFFRPLDVGLYAQLGYSFRNVRLILSYQLGLNNIVPKFYIDTDEHARHSCVGVSAAYILGEGE